MSRRVLPWVAVLVLVGAVLATAGWGRHPSDARRAAPLPQPSRSAGPQPSIEAESPGAEARRLVGLVQIRPRDLPRGFQPVLRREPLRAGWVGVCGGRLKGSEVRRATHQVSFRSGRRAVRQRVVVLPQGAAARVLAELRTDAARCTRPVPPAAVQQPPTLARRGAGRARAGSGGGSPTEQTAVLRSGDLLTVISVDGDADGALTLRLARSVSRRILFFTPTGASG